MSMSIPAAAAGTAVAEHDHVFDRGTARELALQLRQALDGRHEHTHAAVAQDVRDLPGTQQRIDGDEHAAGDRRAQH